MENEALNSRRTCLGDAAALNQIEEPRRAGSEPRWVGGSDWGALSQR
jgi:hypothetical protein